MIKRIIEPNIKKEIGRKKAIILIGARQVGKSTLIENILKDEDNVLWLNGDEPDVRSIFENISSTRLRAILGNKKFIVIDEAQRIEDIGLKIKLITDQIKEVQVVATGSSSFELSSKVNESLTGRKREFKLYPFSFKEMVNHTNLLEEERMIPHRMIYGYYPEVVCSPGEEKQVLRELSNSYLYRDILSIDGIKKPDKLVRLVQALSFQIGNQINYNEIGQLVGIDSKTVEKYIDILEKSFILFRLGSFSRNLRNELKNGKKIYFWDLGIRNAVIGNLANIESRGDVGALWENYCIAERMKKLSYSNSFATTWFWRTQQQKEIDFIEDEDGHLRSFEFKWNRNKSKVPAPLSFRTNYPDSSYEIITPDNISDFLL